MSAFDELYVRFYRAAVACHMSAQAAINEDANHAWRDDVQMWGAQEVAYGICAQAVGVYLSPFKRRQLEGTFFKGKFTIGSAGEVKVYDASSAK